MSNAETRLVWKLLGGVSSVLLIVCIYLLQVVSSGVADNATRIELKVDTISETVDTLVIRGERKRLLDSINTFHVMEHLEDEKAHNSN